MTTEQVFNLEVDNDFFFNPAVQRLVNGVVVLESAIVTCESSNGVSL